MNYHFMSMKWIIFVLPVVLLYFPVFLSGSDLSKDQCDWKPHPNSPEVYYINMDKSVERKHNMNRHLRDVGLSYQRISGLTPNFMYIPNDIESTWRTAWCKTQTSELIPPRNLVLRDPTSPLRNYTSVVAGLCGRGKNKNTPKELGCTTSHLIAMRQAIYSNRTTSRYALIIEDDVSLPFNIDFDALARSAPKGFGILQLFNSNIDSMTKLWKMYQKDPNYLWSESYNLRYWSTCGYMIDREVMKPVIDEVIYEKDGWLQFKIIAGIQGPCAPQECCVQGKFIEKPPCVWASFGYQADSYLYSLAKTYMLSVPLITNGRGVAASTFHQEHVNMFHLAAFRRQRQFINEMLTGKVPPPSFAQAACKQAINETSS
jgi:GR25 family glycosyltransferase involved in LPS biosynthesis